MPEVPKIVHERLRSGPLAESHPDPDVLTAFAEQALLPAEGEQVLEHLALCEDCRAALLLALPPVESIAASQVAAVPEPVTPSRPSKTSWLAWPVFAWPTLRWGALAAGVLFAGALLLHYTGTSNPTVVSRQVAPEAKSGYTRKQAPEASVKSETSTSNAISAERDKALLDRKTTDIASKAEPDLLAQKNALVKAEDAEGRSMSLAKKQMPASASPAANDKVAGLAGGKRTAEAPAVPSARETVEASAAVAEVHTQDSALARNQVSSSTSNMPVSNRNFVSLMASNEAAAPISKAKPATAAQQSTPMQLAAKAAPQSGASVKNFDAPQKPAQFAGVVTDPSGAAIPNAKVTVENQRTGTITSTTTNPSGAYTIKELPIGTYKLIAEASGFKTVSDDSVALNAGVIAQVDFKMPPGQTSEGVEVTGAAQAFQNKTIGSTKWSLSGGMLRRSMDGGVTWQTSLPDGNLLCHAARENDVWTAGKSGVVFHSADNGATWIQVHPSVGDRALSNDVTRIELRQADVILSTSNGETWNTADSGKSWTSK